MTISDIRIVLPVPPLAGNLRAYVSVVFDDNFVVHDIKIVQVGERLLVSMPSKHIHCYCDVCGAKNLYMSRIRYCGECAAPLSDAVPQHAERTGSLFIDVFHPLNQKSRLWLETAVLRAYCLRLEQRGTVNHESVLSQV